MSVILERVAVPVHGHTPRYRVRCNCGRVYVVAAFKGKIEALRTCKVCRPRIPPRRPS